MADESAAALPAVATSRAPTQPWILDQTGSPILDQTGSPITAPDPIRVTASTVATAQAASATSTVAQPAITTTGAVSAPARVASATSAAAQPTVLVSSLGAAGPAAPRSGTGNPGAAGCAVWTAVLADPLLRPRYRLRLRGGKVQFAASEPGSAEVDCHWSCGGRDVREGWHHLLLFRDSTSVPLYAGPVTSAQDGRIESDGDLSSLLALRAVTDGGFLAEDRVADPTTWLRRLLADANQQGPLPIVPVQHGTVADVQATIGASVGDTLDDVLDTLTDLGIVWAMQGPVMRYGINWSAPHGGILTDRDFHRPEWRTGGELVTEVRAVNGDGQQGVWPRDPRRSPPVGVKVIQADLGSSSALTRLARNHYERLEGRAVSLPGARLRRGVTRGVREFVPGRRFTVLTPGGALHAVVAACEVTLGGGGAETEVAVDLDKAVPPRPRTLIAAA